MVREVARAQASKNIHTALRMQPSLALLSDHLSGSQEGRLYDVRFASSGTNTWSRARRAATRLSVRIDVSSDDAKSILVVDDVFVTSSKAVRGLRSAVRNRHILALSSAPHQGAAARGILLETKSKDMARLVFRNSPLQFGEWDLIHQARLGLLPLHGAPGYQPADKSCRRCGKSLETAAHVLNACPNNMAGMT